ncbi:Glucokinase [Bythopirellula polymerisocia]|uniref:Glucokinase n=1 Tax=Bythopirellula polymerisocia TaxID=2528003 RepID=A0A5C6C9T5_9BACT|nr:Glucokinase [Bythopirellula polymerisocia]
MGRTFAFHSVPTDVDRGPEHAVERIAGGVVNLLESARMRIEDVARIGLATPGPMDIGAGLLLTPGNLPGWWDFPIREQVAAACGLPVRFANDANAAAYGEYWQGAGARTHSMVLLTLGTGIGGGVVIQDSLVEGSHSCGAECGFILIDPRPDARRDSLNNTGTLEAYCGSYGVVGRVVDALAEGRDSNLTEVLKTAGALTPLAIARAAEAGDALAIEIVLDTAKYLALGIVTLIHIVDPERVVLGGAMNFGGAGHPLGERFLQQVRDEVRPRLLPPLRKVLHIEFAKLGGNAGYVGAAGLARLEHLQTV